MSDEPRDPNAPNIESLRALRPFVRKAARGIAENKIGGKGQKMPLPPRPMNLCNICGAGFNFERTSNDIQLKHDQSCPECTEKLKDGFAAVISDNRFAFIKADHLADMAGHITRIDAQAMNAIEAKFTVSKMVGGANGDK